MANPNPTPKPENLTAPRWPKGVSGNPGGRPRRSVAEVIRDFLAKEVGEGVENLDEFVDVGMKAAMGIKQDRKPDFRFWKEIVDRHDGKITEPVDDGKDPGDMTDDELKDAMRVIQKRKADRT